MGDDALIWLHEDALRADHPVFALAGRDAEAIFIWDNVYFDDQNYSLKRLVFIYECLAELPITLYQGDSYSVISNIIGGRRLYVPETPNPHWQGMISELSQEVSVSLVEETPLTTIADDADMGRFFRYWNRARKSAMSRDGL